MKVGFYAPLKSTDHPLPSGDRTMARLLLKALTACGYEVEILSRLRSWEGKGCQSAQAEIIISAEQEVERLTHYYQTKRPPELIFVYHVYHKAPDWIGVELANRLHIPYLIAEASFAPKQAHGRWHNGHQQTLKCVQQAQTIIALNPLDVECLKPLLQLSSTIELIRPFIDRNPSPSARHSQKQVLRKQVAERNRLATHKVWLITVAMMREGDKSTSYQQLADTLHQIDPDLWELIVIGDGREATRIQNFFSGVAENCFFTGKLEQQSIEQWLAIGDIFVWPAVNEAYGLALLEALAAGLPAVVQNYGGVSSIVEHKKTGYVTNPNNRQAFTRALRKLINDEDLRKNMATASVKKFATEHRYDMAVGKIDVICNNAICHADSNRVA